MDDLDDFNRRQCSTDDRVNARFGSIDKLESVGQRAPVMGDDDGGRGFTGQQESGDGRRNRPGDAQDEIVGDRAGAAGHGRDQPQGRSPEGNSQLSFFLRSDAANLHPCFHDFSNITHNKGTSDAFMLRHGLLTFIYCILNGVRPQASWRNHARR